MRYQLSTVWLKLTILFITSGAFQVAKPSDLIPELQGRLPIRVELEAPSAHDFKTYSD